MTTPLKSDALLAVEGLGIQVGGKRLLRDIGFSLRAGEALTLVGESGAGKSLLAQAIMGNLPPALQARGQITLDGATTRAEDAAARRALWGRKLALLPQEPSLALNPWPAWPRSWPRCTACCTSNPLTPPAHRPNRR